MSEPAEQKPFDEEGFQRYLAYKSQLKKGQTMASFFEQQAQPNTDNNGNAGSQKSLEELRKEIEQLRKVKILEEDVKVKPNDAKEFKKVEEQKKIREEIDQIERLGFSLPPDPTSVRIWRWDSKGEIVDFTLTDCRTDLVYRIKTSQLYTLEECKILIKEIVTIMKKDAEVDIKNLMFLSKFRTEMMFPKPIVSNYLYPNDLEGFPDTEEVKQVIYGKIPKIEKEENMNNGPFDWRDNPLPMTEPKQKLENIVLTVNKNLVKLIDNTLRQRKERLLLASTIMEELEGHTQLKMYFDPNDVAKQMKKKKVGETTTI